MDDPKKKEEAEEAPIELTCKIDPKTREVACKVRDLKTYETLRKNPPKKFVAVFEEEVK
jgi:hypothetical protein